MLMSREVLQNVLVEKMAGSEVEKFCEFCGAKLEQVYFKKGNSIIFAPAHQPCSCSRAKEQLLKLEELKAKEEEEKSRLAAEEKKQKRINNLLGKSGMSKRALMCKFSNYDITPQNRASIKLCKNYVSNFEEITKEKRNGLFLSGECGVGKSHLVYAIANELITERKTSVICMTMIDLLLKLKSSYAENKTEEAILKIYENCSLLIIDDLGKEKPTEWALQMIYAIIDRRYNALKPVIITTNYGAKELIEKFTINDDSSTAEAIVDRLFEMCQYLFIDGDSYRKR